jgi:hypothetical protein
LVGYVDKLDAAERAGVEQSKRFGLFSWNGEPKFAVV